MAIGALERAIVSDRRTIAPNTHRVRAYAARDDRPRADDDVRLQVRPGDEDGARADLDVVLDDDRHRRRTSVAVAGQRMEMAIHQPAEALEPRAIAHPDRSLGLE